MASFEQISTYGNKVLIGLADQLIALCKLILEMDEQGIGTREMQDLIDKCADNETIRGAEFHIIDNGSLSIEKEIADNENICGVEFRIIDNGSLRITKDIVDIYVPLNDIKEYDTIQELVWSYEIKYSILSKLGVTHTIKDESMFDNVFKVYEFALALKSYYREQL